MRLNSVNALTLGVSTVLLFSSIQLLIGQTGSNQQNYRDWPLAGRTLSGARNQPHENLINSSNASMLAPAWVFTTGAGVSATPTVSGDAVYFPDWAGNLYAVNKNTGQQIWQHQISDYDGVSGALARVSPAIRGDELILGDIENESTTHDGANVMAVDRKSGSLRWITKVDSQNVAIITGSPVVFDNVVYQGISSNEEFLANGTNYQCCIFRGGMVALNADTGAILWKMYDMPENGGQPGGYSGGAIWQAPAIDARRGLLYVGTGNNYSVPASVETCEAQAIANNDAAADCTDSNDYFDTALALELSTGKLRWANTRRIRWSKRAQDFDVWTVACLLNPANCPSPHGPDYDFGGSGPNLLGNMVGFGEKSGVYWAFNPDNGNVLWSATAGPGGTLGGIEWGTATDGLRIYAAIANNSHTPYTLVPSGQTITQGSWSALDASSGNLLWQTADPNPAGMDVGALSVSNGVVYASSLSAACSNNVCDNNMFALDATTGKVLWSFASGGSVAGGPSIVNGMVYWGSGYPRFGFTPNNQLYAFTVPH